MEKNLVEIFKKAKYKPEPKLALAIFSTIEKQSERMAQIKLWSLAFIGFFSLTGLIPAFQMLLSDLSHSGLYEYFSLIFSDGGSMVSYWKELSFSVAESIPTMSIIFTLSLLFVCFLSIKYFMKQISENQSFSSKLLSI